MSEEATCAKFTQVQQEVENSNRYSIVPQPVAQIS
jgi:hypothetical protein